MPCYALGPMHPSLAPTAWLAPSATLIGDVMLQDESSVWFGAVLRGDNAPIRIGAGSNIQDNAVLHVDPDTPLTLGRQVTVGHQAILHGCEIGDHSLIGMQAVVLNRARIGRNCLVGAGALVTEGRQFEDGWLILGAPARAVRPLTPDEIAALAKSAATYRSHAQRYTRELTEWIP
ncbi:MAG: gamma carbonic anhydrase family protein [Lautropia sp.]|nr:gamma carbonic anhydrase family protein [Lautropia sp.]